MGRGYWIIVADGFGHGLELINGRLYDEGGKNWWPCDSNPKEGAVEAAAFEKHKLARFFFVKVIVN